MHKLSVRTADDRGQWMSTVERLLTGTLSDALGDHLERALVLGSDSWIHDACKTWPDRAGLIRRAAEARSERVSVTRSGTTFCLSLFAVPLVFEFDDDVPASQFDAHVFPLDSAAVVSEGAWHHGPNTAYEFSTRAYRLEELRTIPLPAIRQAASALAQGERAGQPASWPASLFYRRRRSYLRFLVGCHRSSRPDGERGSPGLDTETAARRMAQHAQRALKAQVRVKALFDGTYHDSLFAGMWLYQDARVHDVVAHALRSTQGHIEAVIEWHDDGPGHELALGFISRDVHVAGRSYVLSTRPGDLPSHSISRVTGTVREAGVRQVKQVGPLELHALHGSAMARVRLPI